MYVLDKFYVPTPVICFHFPAYILGGKSEGGDPRKIQLENEMTTFPRNTTAQTQSIRKPIVVQPIFIDFILNHC